MIVEEDDELLDELDGVLSVTVLEMIVEDDDELLVLGVVGELLLLELDAEVVKHCEYHGLE
jgi:hypothetical protein